MIATIIIALLTCITLILSILFFPKIKVFKKEINTYWLICIIGALLMLIFNCIDFKEALDGLLAPSSVNPIKILVLFFSMTFISVFLDELGFFKYLSVALLKECKSNQYSLFFLLYGLVAILTVFTSNDIVILTFTPFICYFAKNAKINPLPYLVGEFAAANTWSMMLIIGNPTNIYLATSANIDFISYLKVMALPTLIAGIIQVLLIFVLFRKPLSLTMNIEFKEKKIKDKASLIIALAHLILCLLLLTVSSYISISMWIICLLCAFSMVVDISIYYLIKHKTFKKVVNTFKRLPYELIPFVLSMFIVVLSLNKQGITGYINNFFGEEYTIIKYGFSSFLSANLMNNIPMSVLFSSIVDVNSLNGLKALYSVIIGSNIGAFLTPVGALAGIMFTNLTSKYEVNYSFASFIKYGLIISIPTLSISLLVLSFIL